MKEKIINVYEKKLLNGYIIITLIKRDNKYIIQKCLVDSDKVNLIISNEYKYIKLAKIDYEKIKLELVKNKL